MRRDEVELWETAFEGIRAMPPLKRRLTLLFGFIGIMAGVVVFDKLPDLLAALPNLPDQLPRLFKSLPDALERGGAFLSPYFVRLAGVSMVLSVGVGLFYFRRRQPLLYGASQIGFAAVTAWFALTKLTQLEPTKIIQLMGATYLVVRGLRDCTESMTTAGHPTSLRGTLPRA